MSTASDKSTLISTSQLMKRWRCSAACIYARAVKQNWKFVKVGKVRSYYLSDIIDAETKKPVRKYNRKRRKPAKTLVETFTENYQGDLPNLKISIEDKQVNVFRRMFLNLKRLIIGK